MKNRSETAYMLRTVGQLGIATPGGTGTSYFRRGPRADTRRPETVILVAAELARLAMG